MENIAEVIIEEKINGEDISPVSLDEIEKKMLLLPQADCPVSHHFAPGLYIREVFLPAGIIAMGHRQKLAHMNSFVKGRVLMLNEDGSTYEIKAPMTFIAPPGRKVGYILEDVVWQNIYPTDETDVDVLEETYLDKSAYSVDYHKRKELDCVGNIGFLSEDYHKVLSEAGISHEQARKETENEADQVPMPFGWHKTAIHDSLIDGKGLFSSKGFAKGEIIAPALLGGMRTPAGRYTNHSLCPNAEPVKMENGDIFFVAIKDINGCQAGGKGEEVTIDYRKALALSGRMKICQE